MNRLELFVSALEKSKEALVRAPFMFPLESAVTQLEFLIRLEQGAVSNSEKQELASVTIGQIAARDIDEFDQELAEQLHEVSSEVAKMLADH